MVKLLLLSKFYIFFWISVNIIIDVDILDLFAWISNHINKKVVVDSFFKDPDVSPFIWRWEVDVLWLIFHTLPTVVDCRRNDLSLQSNEHGVHIGHSQLPTNAMEYGKKTMESSVQLSMIIRW